MIDRNLTLGQFSDRYLGGRSIKTARRTVLGQKIEHTRVNGHIMVRESAAEAWLEQQRVESVDLRSRLQQIRDKIRARRKSISAGAPTQSGAQARGGAS